MRVLYIDVYFLINFTVDLLALYFAALLLHFPIFRWRLTISASIGACFAAIAVLLYGQTFFVLACSLVSLIGMVMIVGKGGSAFRRIKLALLFLLLQLLIGGIVHWGYGFLEMKIGAFHLENQIENQKILYFAVLLLLSTGILRLALALLSHTSAEHTKEVEIEVAGQVFSGSALVDSGSFLRDPIDGTSVVLVKALVARRLFPAAFLSEDTDSLPEEYRKKLRLIPIRIMGTQRILFGIRPDDFSVIRGKKKEHVRVIIAYDREEGNYEGYSVLIPSAVAENV